MIDLREPYASGEQERVVKTVPLTEATFAETGHLVDTLGLEYRPQQAEMAESVAAAFARSRVLLFEAGTGVGKSLAYLLPGIIHAVEDQRQMLVSTNTIALQEQIFAKDLGICRELFEKVPTLNAYKDFRQALLVGKGNYLCTTRLQQAISSQTELFQSNEQDDLERIANWSVETQTGLLQELGPAPSSEVWDQVNADNPACNARNCSAESCFYRKAREQVRKAQVLIVNHSLLFALLGAGFRPRADVPGILHPRDFAVLDEAHTVPGVAADYFGERVSSFGLRRVLLRLYNPKRKRGLLSKLGRMEDIRAVERALAETEYFFNVVRRTFLDKRNVMRIYEPEWAEPVLDGPLKELAQRVAKIGNDLDEGPARDDVLGQRDSIQSFAGGIAACLEMAEDKHAYWTERSGRKGDHVMLRSAPLDVAPYLREHLFTRDTGVLLASATLADGPSMDGFAAKVGATGETTRKVDSPFDYERNTAIFIATDAPAPTRQEARLNVEYLADMILYCANGVSGGSLALFTSYADMHAVAAAIEEPWSANGRPLLVQGIHGSRQYLSSQMRSTGNALLLGTDSFWTGVDIPGPALSQVIITRLPFENPSAPLAEARSDAIKERGGNPFFELTLPDAVIKFRQGIGRLIRKADDRGSITILDARIVAKQYGQQFLAALPKRSFERISKRTRDWAFQPVE